MIALPVALISYVTQSYSTLHMSKFEQFSNI